MKEKMVEIWGKFKLPILVLLIGVLLMLIPLRRQDSEVKNSEWQESFSLADMERKMEGILSNIAGVGRTDVMLTLKSGNTLQLAQDKDYSEREQEKKEDAQVVKLNRGSGTQEVVVTHEIYPTYLGAVVVCDGADNASVCLSVTEAVSVLTGLSSDKIRVEKWN